MALEDCFLYWLWLGVLLYTDLFGRRLDIQRSYPGQGVGIPWAHRTRGDIFPNNNFWTLAGASPKSALTAKHPSLWGVPCPSLTHTKERGEKGRKEKH